MNNKHQVNSPQTASGTYRATMAGAWALSDMFRSSGLLDAGRSRRTRFGPPSASVNEARSQGVHVSNCLLGLAALATCRDSTCRTDSGRTIPEGSRLCELNIDADMTQPPESCVVPYFYPFLAPFFKLFQAFLGSFGGFLPCSQLLSWTHSLQIPISLHLVKSSPSSNNSGFLVLSV
jgi:hypothetical protein